MLVRLPNNTFNFQNFTEAEAADYLLMCGYDHTQPKNVKMAFAKRWLDKVGAMLWTEVQRGTFSRPETRSMEILARKIESYEGLILIVKLADVAREVSQ